MPEVRSASATSAREWIETGEQCMERRIFDQVNTMPIPVITAANMRNVSRLLGASKMQTMQEGFCGRRAVFQNCMEENVEPAETMRSSNCILRRLANLFSQSV